MKKLILFLALVGLIGTISADDDYEMDFYMLKIVDFWADNKISDSLLLSSIDIWIINEVKFEVLSYENGTFKGTGKIKGFDILLERMFWTINEFVNEEESDFYSWQNSAVEFGYVYQIEIARLNLTNRTDSAIHEIQKLDPSDS